MAGRVRQHITSSPALLSPATPSISSAALWPLTLTNRGNHQDVKIITKDATLRASREVLTKHSEYFSRCLQQPYTEADGVVRLDDIDAKHMGYYIGLAYSYSSIAPHAPPRPADNPESSAPRQPLRDLVEVFKLCDRFISPQIADFVVACIKTAIGDGHRALYRSHTDDGLQTILMRDFADGYEALEMDHEGQNELGELMVLYFSSGVRYTAWNKCMKDIVDRPGFIGAVSCTFARKLAECTPSVKRLRRKEMAGPS